MDAAADSLRHHCCICLENTLGPGDSMTLLACGCKVAWFHTTCEANWIENTEFPYTCPTCRRAVPMITNYSFFYYAGDDQKHLWHIVGAAAIEAFLLYRTTTAIPIQTACILATPFIIVSNRELPYFLGIVQAKMIVQVILFYFNKVLAIPTEDSYPIVSNFGFTLILLMFAQHYVDYFSRSVDYIHADPFTPYAISREIKHAGLITKPPPDPLERNEPAIRDGLMRMTLRSRRHRG